MFSGDRVLHLGTLAWGLEWRVIVLHCRRPPLVLCLACLLCKIASLFFRGPAGIWGDLGGVEVD